MSREIRVGVLLLTSLAVLAGGIFLIGERSNLFGRKNRYSIRFETVSGLASGNPVQLDGVRVGEVESVLLPERVDEKLLLVTILIDQRYGNRVRADSVGRIKTLGLLGDKYIALDSGSPAQPPIPVGGEIPAAPATDVDRLIASGEDLVENVVAISVSLRNILAGMEAGEGILGELTTDSEAGRRAKETMLATLDSVQSIGEKIESGEGLLAALINDPELSARVGRTAERLELLLDDLEGGEGVVPLLLHDAPTRERVTSAVDDFGAAAADIAALTSDVRSSEGLLRTLLSDEELGREVAEDLRRLISNLNSLSEKLDRGDGTIGRLITDPSIFEAVNDIIVGIDESRFLRWLIRNRQKKGIEKRFESEGGTREAVDPPADAVN